MADVDIHCNVIKCRRPLSLEAQACVTSCSHIFCMDCSNTIFSKSLLCPACNTTLSQESDDIMITQLNPTEEYKSFVLAGLKPDMIFDVCSRAISFYEYQTSQELAFKTMLQKNTQDKYNSIKSQFDLVTRDINHIIKVEKEKHKAIVNDYELEKKKSQQICKKLEEKSRQFQKLKIMYEKLKRKSIAPNIQESFHAAQLQQHQQQPMMNNTRNNIMSFSNHQKESFMDNRSDILSTFTTTNPSVFIPQQQQQQQRPNSNSHSVAIQQQQQYRHCPKSSSRIPSPTKSVFSVRSTSNNQRSFKEYHLHRIPPSEP